MGDDLDFDQMLGELAAMKTDLANRQYTRGGSARTPRRPRPSRTATGGTDGDVHKADHMEPESELITTEAAISITDSLIDSLSLADNTKTQNGQIQSHQAQPQHEDQLQLQQSEPLKEPEQSLLSPVVEELPTLEQPQEPAPAAVDPIQEQPQQQPPQEMPEAEATAKVDSDSTTSEPQTDLTQQQPNVLPARPVGPKSLARSDSRRQVGGAPVPTKSAQRTRSISRGSGNSLALQTAVKEQAEHEEAAAQSGRHDEQQLIGTPRQAAPRPAVPQRSHSRVHGRSQNHQQGGLSNSAATSTLGPATPTGSTNSKTSAPAGAEHVGPVISPPHTPTFGSGSTSPAIPPRSRSGSSSLSRSASLNKHELQQQHQQQQQQHDSQGGFQPSLSISPRIPEDPELEEATQQHSAKSPRTMASQEPYTHDDSERLVQHATQQPSQQFHQQAYKHTRQQSQPSQGYPGNNQDSQHALLPTAPIPAQEDGQQVHATARPVIRKQKSADPGALYREQQRSHEEASMEGRGRLPSRHVSERHPRKPSTNDDQDDRGRGRAAKESGGGFFAWARSRSKSRDPKASKSDHQDNNAPPMPEPVEQYNPALIPSRSVATTGALLREKSLPRKTSNNNLQEGWPTYDPHAIGGAPPQRNKSLTRGPSNGGPFSRLNKKSSENNLAHHLPGSIMTQTNATTTHHEAMVRGMGMGSTPMTPAVLLTPQPSLPLNTPSTPSTSGTARGMALAMMKDGADTSSGSHVPPSTQQQMQQRAQQLQQAQLQHLQLQQQKLATAMGKSMNDPTSPKSPTGPNAAAANQTIKMVATRIYIQTESDFKSVNLTSTSTALDVLRMLQDRGTFGEPGDGRYHDRWTIFEYSKEFMIERPLRDFEVILDLMKTWEADKDNKMICKSFPAREELTAKEVARLVSPAGQASFVRPHGWVHIETKKGKWSKRYLHITDTAVYHSKDEKFSGETMLCFLRNFDVYMVQVPRKKAPTKFGFALRSSDSIHIYESPEDDYIHYICTDTGDSLRDWLTGLRAAKGIHMYHANPETIREGIKRATELNGESTSRLTEEQVSMAEAKLAGWGLTRSGTNTIRR